jgi:hypothetical protein
MLPSFLFCSLVAIVLGRILYAEAVMRRLYRCDWKELLGKLEAIPHAEISRLGDDYLNPRSNQIEIEPNDIWTAIGGLEGVRRMRRNARILIALAAHAQRWNFTESVIVMERMRRDAMHLQRATLQITLRTFLHLGSLRVPFHLHESAGSYYLMTKRLMTLYQNSHSGLYPRLVLALQGLNPQTTPAA